VGWERRDGPRGTAGSVVLTGEKDPFLVGSASKKGYVSVYESRHGCFGVGEEGDDGICWHYENSLHRGSIDVAWSTTCTWLILVTSDKSPERCLKKKKCVFE
jgi:hypothetical protein